MDITIHYRQAAWHASWPALAACRCARTYLRAKVGMRPKVQGCTDWRPSALKAHGYHQTTPKAPTLTCFKSAWTNSGVALNCRGRLDILSVECTHESREVQDLGGTADVVMIGPRHSDIVAIVMDWKFGAGIPVHAEGNYQLMAYGQLVIEDYPQADFAECVIVQPRIDNGISDAVFYREDLAAFVSNLQSRLQDDGLSPGTHCRFCPAGDADVCPALKAQAVDVFVDVPLPNLDYTHGGVPCISMPRWKRRVFSEGAS